MACPLLIPAPDHRVPGHPRRLEIELVEVAPFLKGREADETVPKCGFVESCAGIAIYRDHAVDRLKGALDLLHRVHTAADD